MKKYSLTPYQRNIWNVEKSIEGTAFANIGALVKCNIDIDYDIFVKAVDFVVCDNINLRMRIDRNGNVYYTAEYKVKVNIVITDDVDSDADKWIREPFNLYDSSLFDVKLIECKGISYIFFKLHHILGDGVAAVNICCLFEQAYNSLSAGEVLIPSINLEPVNTNISPIRYNRAVEYFNSVISDEVRTLKYKNSLRLEADRASISIADAKEIREYCRNNNISTASIFYSALYIYFSKVMDRDIITFGAVMMNRDFNLIGAISMCANTLPLVIKQGDSFLEICKAVSKSLASLMEFSFYSTEDIYTNQHIRENLYDISVSYRNNQLMPRLKLGSIRELFNGCCDSNIRFFINEYRDTIGIDMIYKKSICTDMYASLLLERIAGIINAAIHNENISILSERDNAVYSQMNNTNYPIENFNIYELFAKYCSENSEKVTIIDSDNKFTYNMVYKYSNRLICYLNKMGLKCGDRVGVNINRSVYLPIVFFALLKGGFVYLPVPFDCGTYRMKVYEDNCSYILREEDIHKLTDTDLNINNICDTAYTIFTSGSSGVPKGVSISRRALYNRMSWMHRRYNLARRILQKTPFTFDVSVWELLSPAFGAQLYMLGQGDEKYPDRIVLAITKYSIQIVHFVPSMLEVFIDYCVKSNVVLESIEDVFVSGEKLTPNTIREFNSVFANAKLHNLYGPTECAIDVTYYDVTGTEENIPIGKPVDNTHIYILNSLSDVMPCYETGEICISGVQVGSGYIDGNTGGFMSLSGQNIYRTGDIGYIDENGYIYFVGRNDSQYKIRGMRVDTSAVEKALANVDGIDESRVLVDKGRIIAFYKGSIEYNEVILELKKELLSYELPSLVERVEEIPLNSSGKTDYKVLTSRVNNSAVNIAVSLEERLLLDAVNSEIDNNINVDSNVFDYGLDSLGVIRVANALSEKGLDIDFSDFYEYKTVRGIIVNRKKSRFLTILRDNNSSDALVCVPYGGAEPQVFNSLASKIDSMDVLGVYISAFDKNATVENIAQQIYNQLTHLKYNSYTILGHCVGSVVAMKLAELLENNGVCVNKVVVGASLPSKGISIMGNIVSHWDMLSTKSIAYILEKLGKDKVTIDNTVARQFKIDARRFFNYMNNADKITLNTKVAMVFGDMDSMTKGYSHLYKKWYDYLNADICVYTVKGGHYFVKYSCIELANIITDK